MNKQRGRSAARAEGHPLPRLYPWCPQRRAVNGARAPASERFGLVFLLDDDVPLVPWNQPRTGLPTCAGSDRGGRGVTAEDESLSRNRRASPGRDRSWAIELARRI